MKASLLRNSSSNFACEEFKNKLKDMPEFLYGDVYLRHNYIDYSPGLSGTGVALAFKLTETSSALLNVNFPPSVRVTLKGSGAS